jgi:microcystin-dependent protein
MGEPFIGEIRMFGGNFAPSGWAFCNGQLLPISENDALFNLIGTTYGGDGQDTFGLPDLQGRIPIHAGTGPSGNTYQLGEKAGVETVTLTTNQIPIHSHGPAQASSSDGTQSSPTNGVWAKSSLGAYSSGSATVSMNVQALSLSVAGGSQPHDNMMPFLAISFIISLFGVFPSQN